MKCSTLNVYESLPLGVICRTTRIIPRDKRHESSRDISWLVHRFIKTSQARFAGEISANEAMRAFRTPTWDEANSREWFSKSRTFISRMFSENDSHHNNNIFEKRFPRTRIFWCYFPIIDSIIWQIYLKNTFVFEEYSPKNKTLRIFQMQDCFLGEYPDSVLSSRIASANLQRACDVSLTAETNAGAKQSGINKSAQIHATTVWADRYARWNKLARWKVKLRMRA